MTVQLMVIYDCGALKCSIRGLTVGKRNIGVWNVFVETLGVEDELVIIIWVDVVGIIFIVEDDAEVLIAIAITEI